MCVCVHFKKDKLYPNVTVSYLLSACVSLAGLGNFMQDVLWCFSQVKGTIDIGVAEGKSIFPFVAAIKTDSIVILTRHFPTFSYSPFTLSFSFLLLYCPLIH
uniref:Uncharacterized protein n=1 Tax=Strigops habroptila TaxID=2489341 RepID=A0A672UX83_STRHB